MNYWATFVIGFFVGMVVGATSLSDKFLSNMVSV